MEINKLIEDAVKKIKNNYYRDALKLLNMAKSIRVPQRNLDTLRARCFLDMNRRVDAKQALLEELAYFPDNDEALTLLKEIAVQEAKRFEDRDFNDLLDIIWPYTMLSQERLFSLYMLAKEICNSDLAGNFVECGVARGGSSALLGYVIKHHSHRERILFSFDSFEGMPDPTAEDMSFGQKANDTGWGSGTCAAPEHSLLEICSTLGVVDFVRPVKGYFHETLPRTMKDIREIAFLHIDGDWYESTKSILRHLYSMVNHGGIIQVDDYGHWAGCKRALHEFEELNQLTFDMHPIDATGVWFEKTNNKSWAT
jgi:hypothetical protein